MSRGSRNHNRKMKAITAVAMAVVILVAGNASSAWSVFAEEAVSALKETYAALEETTEAQTEESLTDDESTFFAADETTEEESESSDASDSLEESTEAPEATPDSLEKETEGVESTESTESTTAAQTTAAAAAEDKEATPSGIKLINDLRKDDLTWNSDDVTITVALDDSLEIPDDAELYVDVISSEDTNLYANYATLAEEVIKEDGTYKPLSFAEFYQFTISYDDENGEAVTLDPADYNCTVTVEYANDGISLENNAAVETFVYQNAEAAKTAAETVDKDEKKLHSVTMDLENSNTIGVVTYAAYTSKLTAENDDVIVTVDFSEDAKIPADAELSVTTIDKDDDLYEDYKATAVDLVPGVLDYFRLYDISITENGEKIEPASEVGVTIRHKDTQSIPESESMQLIHMPDDGDASALAATFDVPAPKKENIVKKAIRKAASFFSLTNDENSENETAESESSNESVNDEASKASVDESANSVTEAPTPTAEQEKRDFTEVSFTTDSFSVYAEAGSLETVVIAANGERYKVTVTYDKASGILGDAVVQTKIISSDDPNYQRYLSDSEKVVEEQSKDGFNKIIGDLFLDITILNGNNEVIEPAEDSSVNVRISLDDPLLIPNNDFNYQIIHFKNSSSDIELLDYTPGMNDEEKISEFIFNTNSFSTIDVAMVSKSVSSTDTVSNKDPWTVYENDENSVGPEAVKTLEKNGDDIDDDGTPDGDGTYTLGLTIRGAEVQHENQDKMNIVIVMDTSNSMTRDVSSNKYDGTVTNRFNAEKKAVKQIGTELNKLNEVKHEDGTITYTDNVALGVVTFASKVEDTDVSDVFTGYIGGTTDNNPSEFISYIGDENGKAVTVNNVDTYWQGGTGLSCHVISNDTSRTMQGATNWEAALNAANAYDFGTDRSTYPTYIIFVTDGNPTMRVSEDGGYGFDTSQYYNAEERDYDLQNTYTGTKPNNYQVYMVDPHAPDTEVGGKNITGNPGIQYFTSEGKGGYNIDKRYYDELHCFGNGQESDFNDLIWTEKYIRTDLESNGVTLYKDLNYHAAVVQAEKIVKKTVNNEEVHHKTLYAVGAFGQFPKINKLVSDAGEDSSYYYESTDSDQLADNLEKIIQRIKDSATFTNVAVNDPLTSLTATDVKAVVSDASDNDWSGDETKKDQLFTYYKNGEIWEDAPSATIDKNGNIKWDLSKDKNGNTLKINPTDTYTVKFRVWPNQEAYDTVAELKNGTLTYDNLNSTIKSQIIDNGDGTYSFRFNKEGSLIKDDQGNYKYEGGPYSEYNEIKTVEMKNLPDGVELGKEYEETEKYTYTYGDGTPITDDKGNTITQNVTYKVVYTQDPNTKIYTKTSTIENGIMPIKNPDPVDLQVAEITAEKQWVDLNGNVLTANDLSDIASITLKLIEEPVTAVTDNSGAKITVNNLKKGDGNLEINDRQTVNAYLIYTWDADNNQFKLNDGVTANPSAGLPATYPNTDGDNGECVNISSDAITALATSTANLPTAITKVTETEIDTSVEFTSADGIVKGLYLITATDGSEANVFTYNPMVARTYVYDTDGSLKDGAAVISKYTTSQVIEMTLTSDSNWKSDVIYVAPGLIDKDDNTLNNGHYFTVEEMYVTDKNGNQKTLTDAGFTLSADTVKPMLNKLSLEYNGKNKAKLLATNTKKTQYILPSAGGHGALPFTTAGLILILTAASIFVTDEIKQKGGRR